MKGNLGKVNLNSIKGWAFSEENRKPVMVSILLDNVKITEIVADIPRKDVFNSQLNASLHCGFNYQFPDNLDLKQFKELRITFSNSKIDLQGSPFDLSQLKLPLKDKTIRKGQNTPLQIETFFMHVPKTAGTSFRLELLNYFGEDAIFPNHQDLINNNDQYPVPRELINKIPKGRRSGIKVISGHYGLNIKRQLFPKSKPIIFLREPIARAISNLKHLQRHSTFYKGKSLMDIAMNGGALNPEIRNRQTFMLWNGRNENKKYDVQNAKKRISMFKFIGITEHYKASIELCNHTFNWDLKGDFFVNKASDTVQNESVMEELISYLNENNKADIELYEYALSLFKEKCINKDIKL